MNGFLENLSNIMTGKRQKTINMSLDDIVSSYILRQKRWKRSKKHIPHKS